MASLDVIRTITIRAQEQGVSATEKSVGALGTTIDATARKQLSMEKQLQSLERRFVAGAKEVQDYEKIVRQLTTIVGQFPQAQEQANRILDAAATKLLNVSTATNKMTAAMSENAMASKAMVSGMTAAGSAADKMANSVQSAAAASAAASKQILTGMSQIGAKALESSVATQKLTEGLSQAGKDAALPKQLDRIAQGMTDATNASKNMIQGMSAVGSESARTGISTGKFGDATKVARYEMLNFTRQATDVVVGLQSGQGVFTILVQQGSQIADIFQTAAVGGRNFGTALLALFNPLTVITTAILAMGAAAAVAAFQWVSAQKAIQQSLLGIGRGSGATVADINKIAESAKELSTSEAGKFASTLASTGKIGIEVMKELTNVAKDTSRVLGVDLDETAKIVAKDFANLETGVTDLNERFGSFSAATAENIALLIKQGDRVGAQKAALDALKAGLEGVNNVVSNSARGWTALTNAISDAWTKLGQFVATSVGLGPALDLKQQAAALTTQINAVVERLDLIRNPRAKSVAEAQLEVLRKKLADVQAEMDKTATKANQTAANIASAFQQKQIDVALPEIIKQKDADTAVKAMEAIVEGLLNGKIASDDLGRSLTQAVAALAVLKAEASDVESAFKSASDTLQIAAKAAVAVSPGAKAEVARLQQLNSLKGTQIGLTERGALADQAAANSLLKFNTEQSEAMKARKLSADQSLETAQKEIDVFGKTLVQQKEELLNLQSKHQLQQAALAAGLGAEGFNKAELKRLETINKQTAALQAQKEVMQELAGFVGNFINTFVQGMVDGKSAVESLSAAMKGLGASITAAASKQIGESIVGGAGDLIKGISGIAGLGGPAGIAIGAGISILGTLFDNSKKKQEDQQRLQQVTDAMNQANDALKSVTSSFYSLTEAADGAVTATIKNAKTQFEQLKNAAESARAAATVVVNTPGNTPAAMAAANASIASANQAVTDATQRLADFNMRTIKEALDNFAKADLSPVAQAIKDLQDKAEDLRKAMIETGSSAEEAADAVGKKLVEALDQLKAKVTNDLQRKINDLTGNSWMNQVNDLFQDIKDATAAGVDPQVIASYKKAVVQSIIDANKITGQAFTDFINTYFPDMKDAVHEFNEEASKTTEKLKRSSDQLAEAVKSLDDRLLSATTDANTLEGALAIFDRRAQREREAEVAAGGENLVKLEEVQAAERLKIIEDFNRRAIANTRSLQDRLLAATVDANTLEGTLAIFDRKAQREREQAAQDGATDMVLLEQVQAAERLNVIKEFNDKAIQAEEDAAKQRLDAINAAASDIVNYVNSLMTGPESALSPQARLNQAQSAYNAVLAVAQTGDIEAQKQITGFAEDLRKAALDFYGSSTGYQLVLNQIQTQLLGLPAPNQATDPVVDALLNSVVPAVNANGVAIGGTTVAVGNTTAAVGNTTTAVNSTTSAVNTNTSTTSSGTSTLSNDNASQLAQLNSQTSLLNSIQSLTNSTNSLVSSTNSLTSSSNSLLNSSNSLLSAIQSLITSSNAQLGAINNQTATLVSLDVQGVQTNALVTINQILGDANNGLFALKAVSSHMFAPSGSLNFQLASGGEVPDMPGVSGPRMYRLAEGGRVGTDTVPALLTPGEYVVNRSVTQANAANLRMLNSTGRWPANDNGSIERLLMLIAEKLDINTAVTVSQTTHLTREQRFAARKKAS